MIACVAGGISAAQEKSQVKAACVSGAVASEISTPLVPYSLVASTVHRKQSTCTRLRIPPATLIIAMTTTPTASQNAGLLQVCGVWWV